MIINNNKKSMTLNDCFGYWISSSEVLRLKQSTISTYRYNFNMYLKRHLGGKTIANIDDKDIVAVQEQMAKTLSNKTINDVMSLLSTLLKYARKNGDINDLTIPYRPVFRKDVRVLTQAEQEALKAYCTANLDYFTGGILLALYTGARVGEICASKGGYLDTKNRLFKVRKTLLRIKNAENEKKKTKIIIDNPKSKTAIRDIPIVSSVFYLFESLYNGVDMNSFLLTGNEKFVEPRTFENRFDKILQKVEIPHANVHSLRDTFALNFYQKTHDIKTLSQLLGHSSTAITEKAYINLGLEDRRKSLELAFCQHFS